MVEVQAVQKQMRSEFQQRFTRFRPSGYGCDIFSLFPPGPPRNPHQGSLERRTVTGTAGIFFLRDSLVNSLRIHSDSSLITRSPIANQTPTITFAPLHQQPEPVRHGGRPQCAADNLHLRRRW